MVLDGETSKLLSELKRKRGVVKAALTRTLKFIGNFDPKVEALSLLEFRQEELPQINRKFDDIQVEIELLSTDDPSEEEKEREEFENNYFAARSLIQEIINKNKRRNASGDDASLDSAAPYPRSRLAPIDLPKFNGNIQEWEAFFYSFKVMVHQQDSYSPAHKFHYLRSTLSGQALDLIKSPPMTDANYGLAIQKLQQRYDNKSLVIQTHIREIMNSPRIQSATAQELSRLQSHVAAHLAALEALSMPIKHWDAWLVTILVERMDGASSHEWQLRQRNTELPKYNEVMEFLASRSIAFESSEALAIRANETNHSSKKASQGTISKRIALAASSESKRDKCSLCEGSHKLYACLKFKELSVSDRFNHVRGRRLCFNCLAPHHMSDTCRSKYSCIKCRRAHNTLLHFEGHVQDVTPAASDPKDNEATFNDERGSDRDQVSLLVNYKNSHVFLSTAVVLAADKFGNDRQCRTILDSGSQVNFISKSLYNKLQLPTRCSILPINGIGASHVQSSSCVEVQLKSRVTNFSLNLSCYILPVIVDTLPAVTSPAHGWNIPEELVKGLADPMFFEAGSVDLLIGGGSFFDLLDPERVHLGVDSLCLQGSKFGWIVTGEIGVISLPSVASMGQLLEEDWRALKDKEDNLYGRHSKTNLKLSEEKQTVEHFKENTKRETDGRFIVRLPLKPLVEELGDTLKIATTRFLSVERRLMRDEKLKGEYTRFMEEYLALGHMEEVIDEDQIPKRSFYLPHHAVIKESSLTTKVRVVFDASARSSTGVTLNDVLMCGPNVQEDVFSILARFRKHQYVLTSDIEKMFRQVAVAKTDWDLQRIVWRANPSGPLRTFRLTTVTYGTTSASFLATQCLVTLAENVKESYPDTARIIGRDFYMDDLMTGADTEEECLKSQQEISDILNSAKLKLRKWCSNSVRVLDKIDKVEDDPLFTLEIKDGNTVKSLGLGWKPLVDQFHFNISIDPSLNKCTKRSLLSDLNRVFDPLGFLCPVLLRGKMFLQQIWSMKIDWDTELSSDIQGRWKSFISDLQDLKCLSIPRKVKPLSNHPPEIHGFCDASQEAYGACIYIRTRDNQGKWSSQLLCAKTRVSPLKEWTIPRLELSGALLLVELANKVAESWSVELHTFQLWTDSSIVLGWLNSQNTRLKTFVANRINQILDCTNIKQWRHIRSEDNPADVASRGLKPTEILPCTKWWNGPSWLTTEEHNWKNESKSIVKEEDLPEVRPIRLALITTSITSDLLPLYSDWIKLVRAIAWLGKFVEFRRAKKAGSTLPRYLTVTNLRLAELRLIKGAQADEFGIDLTNLLAGRSVRKGSVLRTLCPFISEDGIILVGGRLENSDIAETQKHPIVLPSKHKVTRLIFEDQHRALHHCGPQALLAAVRQRYWPLRGRVMARSVASRCVTCIRSRPRFENPVMAPLPKNRVQFSRPFTTTGVDFAGPLLIRSGIRRVTAIKTWIAVFVCFTTRAIHLEAVVGLTSDAFMASLRRFMSRRGKCRKIYSDNGTNFVGAQKELSSYLEGTEDLMAREGVEWHFNPPSAPHFGGLWESAVKSVKTHLIRVIKDTRLNLEELQTLLCQIEACVNSRPMTPLNTDPSEPNALTPAHFLVGGTLLLPAESEIPQTELAHLKRWKFVQGLMQMFGDDGIASTCHSFKSGEDG